MFHLTGGKEEKKGTTEQHLSKYLFKKYEIRSISPLSNMVSL